MTSERATRIMTFHAEAVDAAARCLAAGGLVAFPTETVYGLGADATNGQAIARLYAAKGRPSFNPLIAHVSDIAAARRLARFDAAAERLAAAFWPGPLTLVLPKGARCPVADLATAGLDSIAVRVPAHPVARDILAAFGKPVVAPSANRSGHVSPTTAQHVLADLRRPDRSDRRWRAGARRRGIHHHRVPGASRAAAARRHRRAPTSNACSAARLVERRPALAADEAPLAPGHAGLALRAAGAAAARRNALDPGEALLAFGPSAAQMTTVPRAMLNLSASGDLVEAAANLFSHLRALTPQAPRRSR